MGVPTELFQDHFIQPRDKYTREVTMHSYYVDDAVKYLTTMTGASAQEAKTWVHAQLNKGGQFEFKSPVVDYLERGDNGDRIAKRSTLFNYVNSSLKEGEIIAPTFTTYVNPDVQRSFLSEYVEENIKRRGVAKKAMFAAESAKDHLTQAIKEIEQKGKKLANNAISGAHVSASTPLYNKTAHSTLTSTCRITAAYGNANNEKFLSGNRHYHNYHIVLNNIVATVNNFDHVLMQAVIDKYAIHLPTVEEASQCVAYSSKLYWWDKKQALVVQQLLEKLTPLELAAFVYSGDMYHLRQHNAPLIREFLTKLSNKVEGEHSDPLTVIKQAPESYVNLAHQLCRREMAGQGKEYKAMSQTPVGMARLQTLACTIENIAQVIYDHKDLIEAFWMPQILPASVANFPASIRRSALTGDTDSTIFTVQEWIHWYNDGVYEFTDRTHAVFVATVFLASSTITHILAKMSANLGVVQKKIHSIAMKSEFTFDVFIPTQLGKHYFACISCQEGNVYDELKWEIKGAQLRSANAPREIVEDAKKMMQAIINTVLANKKISLQHYLTWVADRERQIEVSLLKGELKYLRSSSIKSSGSYAGEPEDSPYQNHFLWNEVFGPKYGVMPEPPYETYKVSLRLDKPSHVKLWLDKMQDKDLSQRIRQYLDRTEKTSFGTFHMPKDIMLSTGMPQEIIDVIDVEGVQGDICKMYYVILESIGFYTLGDKMKRLLSKSGY